MKVERIAECSPRSILQYFWPALSDNWSSILSGCLRQVWLYNQQSIYIYAYKCLCQCVGKVYYPNVNCVWFDMLGPIISENDPPFFAPWVTSPTNLVKNLKPWNLSNWQKSMFKSGDSHTVWTWNSSIELELYIESIADQTDHFANAFVCENVSYSYSVHYWQLKPFCLE